MSSGVARYLMKMKPAYRISDISAEAQHFLQDCICAQRSSNESLEKVKKDCLWKQTTHKITKIEDSVWLSLFICNTVWLISAKQWLWSACTFAQAGQSHCLADIWSCRKYCEPAHLMWSEEVWGKKIRLNCQIMLKPDFLASARLRAWNVYCLIFICYFIYFRTAEEA